MNGPIPGQLDLLQNTESLFLCSPDVEHQGQLVLHGQLNLHLECFNLTVKVGVVVLGTSVQPALAQSHDRPLLEEFLQLLLVTEEVPGEVGMDPDSVVDPGTVQQ